MSRIPISNMAGEAVGDVEVADSLLVLKRGRQALQAVLVAYRAGRRAGTASTKTKGEVAGSNRKPWAQKGLGRARSGYRQSPVWRGGGVVFGPRPRSYAKQVNRKVARLAFQRAFSEKVADQSLRVLESLSLAEAKTRALAAILKAHRIGGSVLIVLDKPDRAVRLAARNLSRAAVALARDVHPYDLVRHATLLVTRPALAELTRRLGAAGAGEEGKS